MNAIERKIYQPKPQVYRPLGAEAATYTTPEKLLESARTYLGLRNYKELSEVLTVHPSYMSRIRSHQTPLSDAVLLRLHEETGWSFKDMRKLAGVAE